MTRVEALKAMDDPGVRSMLLSMALAFYEKSGLPQTVADEDRLVATFLREMAHILGPGEWPVDHGTAQA